MRIPSLNEQNQRNSEKKIRSEKVTMYNQNGSEYLPDWSIHGKTISMHISSSEKKMGGGCTFNIKVMIETVFLNLVD